MLKLIRVLYLILSIAIYNSLTCYAAPPIFVDSPEAAFSLSEDLKLDVFLLFTASWCASCNIMKNDIHTNLDNFSDIIFCYVDYDKYKSMANQYQVKVLPDYRVYRNKIEIKKQIGYKNKDDLLEWLNNSK